MKVLVTGSAGFIGNHVALRLLERGDRVTGIDCLSPYYDIELKKARRARLTAFDAYSDHETDLADGDAVGRIFADHKPDRVIHLAAQAGVRYSIEEPNSYIASNITGFLNILESCRHGDIEHLVYASTSSVFGANTSVPFSEHASAEHPMSLYAATKKANEMMAHSYAHLFAIPATGLRFFTVYGPWGRPDMALFKFTKAILSGEPIDVFNDGDMQRDFTYIDDIVEGVVRVLDKPPSIDPNWSSANPDPASSGVAPYRIYNIGNSAPVKLTRYIEVIEEKLGRRAEKNFLPLQPGDVPASWADAGDLKNDFGYRPDTPVEVGVAKFIDWYLDYYDIGG